MNNQIEKLVAALESEGVELSLEGSEMVIDWSGATPEAEALRPEAEKRKGELEAWLIDITRRDEEAFQDILAWLGVDTEADCQELLKAWDEHQANMGRVGRQACSDGEQVKTGCKMLMEVPIEHILQEGGSHE